MNPFLKILAEHSLDKYGEKEFENICYVFPNRRSGVFFKHYLLQACKGTFWIPEIYTIQEFISSLSGMENADPVDVSFELYQIYKNLAKHPESYDEFYYWGEMLISDFDELDKYLVPAEKLFKNLADLKEIEQVFTGYEEEQLAVIREFWAHFGDHELSPEKTSFVEMWNLLYPVYTRLNDTLKKKGTGYEGMLYRKTAESIDETGLAGFDKDKIIIAGFNALNRAEKKIFDYIKRKDKGIFFWDYDEEYVNSEIHEAGKFLRRNIKEFTPVDLGERYDHLNKEKSIKIYDLPSDILQTRIIGRILSKYSAEDRDTFDNTAIILGDETLLDPVISSLPDNIKYVNITMGYPIKNTPVYSFADQLLNLQKNLNRKTNHKSGMFYYRDVLSVLNHQYLRYISDIEISEKINDINSRNLIYIEPEFFGDNHLLSGIFRRIGNAADMPRYIREILEETVALFSHEESAKNEWSIEKEYTFHIITRLNKLENIFRNEVPDTGTDTFARLFKKIISKSVIPFEGEPLRGLQIMGILESRLLDFENIIILSMNEGVIPRTHTPFSFIPFGLKLAFGMPGREEHDAIYAYYFYRLIQRAKNISLLYNSKTDGLSTGEKSRYIYQLEYLSRHKPELIPISFNISGKKAIPIDIQKDDEILSKLEEFTAGGNKDLSPSALNTWLDCRLKFYFSYIAKLKEEEEASEDIDASVFGSLLHETLKIIYEKYRGRLVDKELFTHILNDKYIESCLKESFRNSYQRKHTKDSDFIPEGRNVIVYEVVKKLVTGILKKDHVRLPFTVIDVEKQFQSILVTDGKRVRIKGIVDRIDLKDDKIHIIDYKTGITDLTFSNIDDLFNREIKKRKKHIFQTFVYSYLYNTNNNSDFPVCPCIYSTRGIFDENFSWYISMKTGSKDKKEEIIDFRQTGSTFLKNLHILISEIYKPEISFNQTADEDICRYCPYRIICHREVVKYNG